MKPNIPVNWKFVKDVPDSLKKYGLNIGYTGLMHYRKFGLISEPNRLEGYRERFYDVAELAQRINIITLISGLFGKNFSQIPELVKALPRDIFEKVPFYYMGLYSKIKSDSRALGIKEETLRIFLSYNVKNAGNVYWKILIAEGKGKGKLSVDKFFEKVAGKYLQILKGITGEDPIEESLFFEG